MDLIANGFPKCGNHLLVKACELLGVPAQVQHIPFAEYPLYSGTHRIFIKRDPRNLPISMLRWRGKQVTPGSYLTYFRKFQSDPLPSEMMEYAGWLTDPDTLIVSYEAMLASDAEIRRIADYLGVPYIDGAFEELPGYTTTWIDERHSDYAEAWTPEVEAAWAAEGGAEVQAIYGY